MNNLLPSAVDGGSESNAWATAAWDRRAAQSMSFLRSEGARIAVLDPALRTREHARRAVRRLGHQPHAFASAAEMARCGAAAAHKFEMVLLAVEGDADSSLMQLNEVRALVGPWTPVLCLASRDQVPLLSDLHWNAANDVIVSPASFLEFCCVARMFMRRFGVSVPKSDPGWGRYRFSLMSDTVEIAGERIHLRAIDFDVAFELFSHAGRTLTREWLYAAVWDNREDTQSRTLDVSISRLRRILDLEAHGWDLVTVYGVGYRLAGPSGKGRAAA